MEHTGERFRGAVKWYDPRKGYGLIERSDGEPIFVHYGAFRGEVLELHTGDRVEFVIEETPRGSVAHKVTLAG